jgi:hypothetical protein
VDQNLYALILRIKAAVVFFLMGMFLSGCGTKVITTLSVDMSKSNTDNKENQKLVRDICKNIVRKHVRSIDVLNLKEFDSETSPGLKASLKDSNQLSRDNFESDCDKLAISFSKPEICGTTILPVWKEFYKTYTDKKSNSIQDKSNSSKEIQVYIFFVDALEELSKRENCDELPLPNSSIIQPPSAEDLSTFKSSVEVFVKDGNFLVIIIKNSADRRKMKALLADVLNSQERLSIPDSDSNNYVDYKTKIDNLYKSANN